MTFQELLTLAPDFREFSDHMPPELDGRFIPRTYPPYTVIHRKDSPLERIGILLKGTFRVINEFENGNVFMIEQNDAVSFIGEITLFAGAATTSVTIETVTECETAFLPIPVFRQWLESDPRFMSRMLRHIAGKLYCASYSRGERLFYSSSYLLLKYVVGEAEALGVAEAERVVLRRTRRQLSEALGMQEKTINRTISRLCEEGAFSLEHGKIAMSREQYQLSARRLKVYSRQSRNGTT